MNWRQIRIERRDWVVGVEPQASRQSSGSNAASSGLQRSTTAAVSSQVVSIVRMFMGDKAISY